MKGGPKKPSHQDKQYFNEIFKKLKPMPTVHDQQNIKSLNKYRISITDFSFGPRVHHGTAELLILRHLSLSPTIESPTKTSPSLHLQGCLSLCLILVQMYSKKSSGELLQRFLMPPKILFSPPSQPIQTSPVLKNPIISGSLPHYSNVLYCLRPFLNS